MPIYSDDGIAGRSEIFTLLTDSSFASSDTLTTWSIPENQPITTQDHTGRNGIIRWYDPITGRWLSNDPIGISGGLNQYVFCGNNPVNFVDPFGTRTIWQDAGNSLSEFADNVKWSFIRQGRSFRGNWGAIERSFPQVMDNYEWAIARAVFGPGTKGKYEEWQCEKKKNTLWGDEYFNPFSLMKLSKLVVKETAISTVEEVTLEKGFLKLAGGIRVLGGAMLAPYVFYGGYDIGNSMHAYGVVELGW